MDNEFLAIAILRPFEDREADVLTLLRDLYGMLARKGYCRDELYQSGKDPSRLIHIRYWKSEESRREAAEDPDVHRYWHALSEIAEIERVYEQLHPVKL